MAKKWCGTWDFEGQIQDFFRGFLEKLIGRVKEEVKKSMWMNFGRSLMSMTDFRQQQMVANWAIRCRDSIQGLLVFSLMGNIEILKNCKGKMVKKIIKFLVVLVQTPLLSRVFILFDYWLHFNQFVIYLLSFPYSCGIFVDNLGVIYLLLVLYLQLYLYILFHPSLLFLFATCLFCFVIFLLLFS